MDSSHNNERLSLYVTYDPKADAAYLSLVDGFQFSKQQISGLTKDGMLGEVEIDINKDGQVIGIEFVGASSILPGQVLSEAVRI